MKGLKGGWGRELKGSRSGCCCEGMGRRTGGGCCVNGRAVGVVERRRSKGCSEMMWPEIGVMFVMGRRRWWTRNWTNGG